MLLVSKHIFARVLPFWAMALFGITLSACNPTQKERTEESPQETLEEAQYLQAAVALLSSQANGDEKPFAHVSKSYLEHGTGEVSIAGLKQQLEIAKKHKESRFFQVLRSFQDGDYVFVNAQSNTGPDLESKTLFITMDLVRFNEAGKIEERWSVATPFPRNLASPAGGTTGNYLPEQTETNKKAAALLYQALQYGDYETARPYISETLVQHGPYSGGGAPFLSAFRGGEIRVEEMIKIQGQGNFVLVVFRGLKSAESVLCFHLLSMNQGEVSEMWEASAPYRD